MGSPPRNSATLQNALRVSFPSTFWMTALALRPASHPRSCSCTLSSSCCISLGLLCVVLFGYSMSFCLWPPCSARWVAHPSVLLPPRCARWVAVSLLLLPPCSFRFVDITSVFRLLCARPCVLPPAIPTCSLAPRPLLECFPYLPKRSVHMPPSSLPVTLLPSLIRIAAATRTGAACLCTPYLPSRHGNCGNSVRKEREAWTCGDEQATRRRRREGGRSVAGAAQRPRPGVAKRVAAGGCRPSSDLRSYAPCSAACATRRL